jgi:hypothetical protein
MSTSSRGRRRRGRGRRSGTGDDSGNSDSGYQSDVGFTPDGRIVFESRATDLDPRSGDLRSDVFIASAPAEADLGIGLDAGRGPVVNGGDVTYVAAAANAGPDPAGGATVAVLLPEPTAFAGLTTDTGTCAPPATAP